MTFHSTLRYTYTCIIFHLFVYYSYASTIYQNSLKRRKEVAKEHDGNTVVQLKSYSFCFFASLKLCGYGWYLDFLILNRCSCSANSGFFLKMKAETKPQLSTTVTVYLFLIFKYISQKCFIVLTSRFIIVHNNHSFNALST